MLGNVLLKVELKKGVGSFKFPEVLQKNNFQTSVQCYGISYSSFSQSIEKLPCFVICDATFEMVKNLTLLTCWLCFPLNVLSGVL